MTMYTVPAGNISGMVFSLVVAIGGPIGLCIFIRRKYKADMLPFFLGCGTFFVFALVLEQLLHLVVLFHLGTVSDQLMGNIWLYAVYGGLAAGLFEETGRFLTMKFLMKKSLNQENALMYGAGHGGLEAILLMGLTSINNLVRSVMINSGALVSALPEGADAEQALTTLSPLWTVPAWQFYLGGVERMMAMAIHIALSLLVYQAVRYRKRGYLFFLAILFHFLINMVVVLIADYSSVVMAEVSTLIGTILIWSVVWLSLRNNNN